MDGNAKHSENMTLEDSVVMEIIGVKKNLKVFNTRRLKELGEEGSAREATRRVYKARVTLVTHSDIENDVGLVICDGDQDMKKKVEDDQDMTF